MQGLETVQIHVHGQLSKKIVDSLVKLFATSQPLQRLKKLELVVEQARVGEQVAFVHVFSDRVNLVNSRTQ